MDKIIANFVNKNIEAEIKKDSVKVNIAQKEIIDEIKNVKIKKILKNVKVITANNNQEFTVIKFEILPGETKEIDISDFTDIRVLKYQVSLEYLADDRYQTFTINNLNKETAIKTTLYEKLGDMIDYDQDIFINLNDIKYTITNNETENLYVTVLKIYIRKYNV